ncbi:MAG TPA: cytochrome c-type biogenesis CcmF C-terminal domain-containing protein, partial [Gemmatimonadales bacterium]|nr:cytochrome c-type biogenesis CcmF C-terminal domain-containing protein [Gemmatimonadales bacterium]
AASIVLEFVRGRAAAGGIVRLIARNRRRYGGYIVHTGIVMLFVAFTGMAFKVETEASLKPGQSVTLASPYGWTYTFKHLGISQYDALNRKVTAGTVVVSRNGKTIGTMVPEKRQHVDSFGNPTFEPSTAVAIRSDLREDLYVVLGGVVGGTETAVYRFTINPLVWWVWYGGMIVALGGVIVMWPGGTVGSNRVAAGYAAKIGATE